MRSWLSVLIADAMSKKRDDIPIAPSLYSLSNKMDNSLLAVRDINHKYIVVEKGLLVERAANGKQCVEMLKEKPADYYDMILMDIQMPEMDGYQATEMIRNLGDSRAAVPIVAMTANAFEEDRQKALDAGMNAHVSKPVDMNVLFRVMAKFI